MRAYSRIKHENTFFQPKACVSLVVRIMERIIGILNGMGYTAGTGVATALMNSVLFEIENKESYNA